LYQKFSLFNIDIKVEISLNNRNDHFIVFNYHQVGKDLDKKYHNLGNFTQLDFFENQILCLKKNYKVITLEEAIKKANQNNIDGKYACITFDDGDKSIINAMNILEKYNVPATFFINSGYLNNKLACWFHIYQYIKNSPKYQKYLSEDIEHNIKYLRNTDNPKLYNEYSFKIEALYKYIKDEFDMFVSFEQLENINSDLFHIGTHGHEHQRFLMKSKEWQRENIIKDIDILSNLKAYRPIFAIPFGRPHDWNIDTIDIIRELNFDFVYANGGINVNRSVGYQRIPADGRVLEKLI